MAYYKHPDYCSETEMTRQGWSECEKDEQRAKNWDIRLEHYAKNSHVLKNCVQFRRMVDKWAESFQFPSAGVPTMKMLSILKLSRENGIVSETLTNFHYAEKELLRKNPKFASPAAAVQFNTEKHHQLCLVSIKTVVERRERAVAALLMKKRGRGAARDYRAGVKTAMDAAVLKGREDVDAQVAAAVACGKECADSISAMKKKLEHDMMFDIYTNRLAVSNKNKKQLQVVE
jgi:hypothetical protein